jgi:hypothetical protein
MDLVGDDRLLEDTVAEFARETEENNKKKKKSSSDIR